MTLEPVLKAHMQEGNREGVGVPGLLEERNHDGGRERLALSSA